jgi:hypothetical protein
MALALGPNHPDYGAIPSPQQPVTRLCAAQGCRATFVVDRTHPKQQFCSLACSAVGRTPFSQPPRVHARKRLVADRFRRIWGIATTIADEPGLSRRDLATRFHLSERQVQADLNIIRTDMRLPLVRRHGYRFTDDGQAGAPSQMTLAEAQMLVWLLAEARRTRIAPADHLTSLAAKLPGLMPPHLQPLITQTVASVLAPRSDAQGRILTALSEAILRGSWVKLTEQARSFVWPYPDPVIKPELLLPYVGHWYVLGTLQQRERSVMLDLSVATACTLAEAPQ